MREKLMKGIKLVPYGMSLKVNVLISIVMFTLGVVMEIVGFRMKINGSAEGMLMDIGAVFLLCTAMFPGQMVISTDLSVLVQSSAHKKAIQTSIFSFMNLVCSLAAVTLIVVIRLISCGVLHTEFKAALGDLWASVGLTAFLLMVFFAACYKYFVLSMVILYIILFGTGGAFGFAIANGKIALAASLPPFVSVLLCYGLVCFGAVAGNLVCRLLYRKKLSKFAFGASAQRL